MPIIKSAKKAARQATKRTEHNVEIKKNIKAAVKAFKAKPTAETLLMLERADSVFHSPSRIC